MAINGRERDTGEMKVLADPARERERRTAARTQKRERERECEETRDGEKG